MAGFAIAAAGRPILWRPRNDSLLDLGSTWEEESMNDLEQQEALSLLDGALELIEGWGETDGQRNWRNDWVRRATKLIREHAEVKK